ncbi:MAG: exo-alpha-sialidase [Verrucomicrobia bacterium]|nr:exo-alpha-sialidase [Verrucomicrobiota bacterium]
MKIKTQTLSTKCRTKLRFYSFLAFTVFSRVLLPEFSMAADTPFLKSELIFPMEHWHNHASCIVEASNGDLLVCWFHGSGERTADDVKIEGARKRKGEASWSERFTMADTPGFPDTNCTLFIDPQDRLWLLWPTILANEWHTALMKYRIASDYSKDGPPDWEVNEVLHLKPGEKFETAVLEYLNTIGTDAAALARSEGYGARFEKYLEDLRDHASDKHYRRLGWMTRAHPLVLEGTRLIVPLYSDGFSFSLMAITDDWGASWHTSTPLPGGGNIQPSIVRRSDGSLYTLMRDNGPPPKRLLQSESKDRGETWSRVTDSELPNPGSGAEITSLSDGKWILISNDTERGRHSLAVQISDDEGRTWKWKRHLELDDPGQEPGGYHYPSILQAKDGTLHATYSYHLNRNDVEKDADGLPARKSIKHAHFNAAWVMHGDGN